MILRLSRIRRHDTMADPALRRDRKHVTSRQTHAGPATPSLFTDIDSDVDLQYLFMDYSEMTAREREKAKNLVERVSIELALPAANKRLAWSAEDGCQSIGGQMKVGEDCV